MIYSGKRNSTLTYVCGTYQARDVAPRKRQNDRYGENSTRSPKGDDVREEFPVLSSGLSSLSPSLSAGRRECERTRAASVTLL